MIPKQEIDVSYIQQALIRRFWYIVVPFFLISLAGLLYCILATRVYRAQTLILVEPQKVPGEYVSSTVTIDLNSRLRTITQQIKSRTRLEKIILDYDLYPDIRASATMTDAVEAFRKNVDVNVRGGRGAFEVSFCGKDPRKVRDVTNTIADLFIEDNLKLREAQASGTTLFLDREIQRLETALQKKESAIREFNEQNRGFLPENMDQNYRMMSLLQRQLDSINTTIQQTKDRKILLESQLTGLRRMEAQVSSVADLGTDILETAPKGDKPAERTESADLQALRSQLRTLQTRYSDKHPDVMKLKAMIAKLEAGSIPAPDPSNQESDSEEQVEGEEFSLFEAQISDLDAQVEIIAGELESLRKQKNELERELAVYRHRIEKGPQIEQMLTDLTRGYRTIQSNYSDLLDKKFKAQLAENLEIAQQGEQFTILDHAGLPDKPYRPQTRKTLLIAFFLALAGGFGLALSLEYIDRSYYSAKDIENTLRLQVLVSLPRIPTEGDRQRILVRRIVSATALVSMAFILLYAMYCLWKMDPLAMSLAVA